MLKTEEFKKVSPCRKHADALRREYRRGILPQVLALVDVTLDIAGLAISGHAGELESLAPMERV